MFVIVEIVAIFTLMVNVGVEPNLEVDDSDEEEMMVISDKEALNSLEKVIQYLKNTISYLSIILKTLGLRERKV
ncbi:11203_t:CDS:2 [Entrophospora sp. SA101]|nr:11203_t:CDS:2 [Entrophospora sp. SA101]